MGRLKKHIAEARKRLLEEKKADIMHWESGGFSKLSAPAYRYDQLNHFPIRVLKSRIKTCQREGCEKETLYRCLKCNNFLCIGTRKATNCFFLFHIEASKENLSSDSTVITKNKSKNSDLKSNLMEVEADGTKNSLKAIVLLHKLDLGHNSLGSGDEDSESTTLDNNTPLLSRKSGRPIKRKIDPNFKYLPAGSKKKKTAEGSPVLTTKQTHKLTESSTNGDMTTSKLQKVQVRKRKTKPRNQVTTLSYRRKIRKTLEKRKVHQPEQKLPALAGNLQTVQNDSVQFKTSNIIVSIPRVQEPNPVLKQEPYQCYPGEIRSPLIPETIFPSMSNEFSSNLQFHNSPYMLTAIQPTLFKQESDMSTTSSYTLTTLNASESVLSFNQF